MLNLSNLLTGRFLRILFIALFSVSLAACGGGSGGSGGGSNPPPGGGSGGGGGGGGNGGGGNGDTAPTAEVSPNGSLSPRESIVVVFDMPMDPDSLELGGSLADDAVSAWSTGSEENDTLTLTPSGYWKPGSSQSLSVNASSAEGTAMDEAAEAQFDVQAPFSTFQQASVVVGQQDFESGEYRQGTGNAHANTLDLPMGSAAYNADADLLFLVDSGTSRVLGFSGIPEQNNANAAFVVGQPDFSSSAGSTTVSTMRHPEAVTANGGNLVVTDNYNNRVLIYDGVPEMGPVEAAVVLGQDSMDAAESGCAANRFGVAHLHGHFVTPAGKLMVADSRNNRVLVWNEMPTQNAQEPDLVIGQASFDSCAANDNDQNGARDVDNIPTARTMDHPTNIWSDDERVFIADQANNRVLIWNTFPTENFAEADIVIGQATMGTNAANDDDQDGEADGTPSARTLFNPWDVRVAHGQMFVTDMENHRILIWNSVPSESFAPADVVIGQENFESNTPNAGGISAGSLDRPAGVQIIGGKMFITDWENSRVLIFDPQE